MQHLGGSASSPRNYTTDIYTQVFKTIKGKKLKLIPNKNIIQTNQCKIK